MLAFMGAILLTLLIVGPAALTGQPLLIAVGAILGAAILFVTRRRRGLRDSAVLARRR